MKQDRKTRARLRLTVTRTAVPSVGIGTRLSVDSADFYTVSRLRVCALMLLCKSGER